MVNMIIPTAHLTLVDPTFGMSDLIVAVAFLVVVVVIWIRCKK